VVLANLGSESETCIGSRVHLVGATISLHSLNRTVWGRKFKAIVESEKYDTLTMNELFSKLKSAEVDRGMTTKIEGSTDSHSLALIGGSK
jgi:hypothetical protein